MKKLLICLLSVLILLSSCMFEPKVKEKSTVHIISIGLDYTNTTKYSELIGAVNDAMDVAYCLKDIYTLKGLKNDVTLMLSSGITANEETTYNYPTAENILNTIKNLKVNEKDMIVLFYSGHGGADDEKAHLCTAIDNSGNNTLLDMEELFKALNSKGCISTLILDTCYAGTATEYTETAQYFDYAFRYLANQKVTNVGVIASSDPFQESYYDESDPEQHGLFTTAMLEVLGWEHHTKQQRLHDAHNVLLSEFGSVTELKGRMPLSALYDHIDEIWDDVIFHKIPLFGVITERDMQYPALSFNTKDIILIPLDKTDPFVNVPDNSEEHFVAAIGNNRYKTLQEAIDAIASGADSGKIYVVDNIETDESIVINTDKEHPIEIEFGSHTVKFKEGVKEGFVFRGEGTHEEGTGTVMMNGGVFTVTDPDCITFYAYEDQGVYITAVSVTGNALVKDTATIQLKSVKKLSLTDLDIEGNGKIKIYSGENMNIENLDISGDGEFDIAGGTIEIDKTHVSGDGQFNITGGDVQFNEEVINEGSNKIQISGEETIIRAPEKIKEVDLQNAADISEEVKFEEVQEHEGPQEEGSGIYIILPKGKCYGKITGEAQQIDDNHFKVSFFYTHSKGEPEINYNWFVNGHSVGRTLRQSTFETVVTGRAGDSVRLKCEVMNNFGSSFTSEISVTLKADN